MNHSLVSCIDSNKSGISLQQLDQFYSQLIVLSDYRVQIYKVMFQSYLTISPTMSSVLLKTCSLIKMRVDENGHQID